MFGISSKIPDKVVLQQREIIHTIWHGKFPSSDGNKRESFVLDAIQLGIDYRDSDVNLFRHWIEKLQVTGHSCTKMVIMAPHKLMSQMTRSWSGQKIQIQIFQFNETCFLLLCWVFLLIYGADPQYLYFNIFYFWKVIVI